MAKFTLWPKFHLNKRNLLFLVVASAISLNLLLTCAVLYFHKRDFLGQFILSQTQTALGILSNEVAYGNYRRVMEQLASQNTPMGAQTQSILFYNISDKEIFTSNNDNEILRCRQDFADAYYESFQNTYVVCAPLNSMLFIQIVFKANWLYFLQTPQFILILIFNLVFAAALTLLTLLGMNLYLDRFILLLNRLLQKGTLDKKNVPQEFNASFTSIKNLSSALETLKAKISKHTQEAVLSELSHKVLHNIRNDLSIIQSLLPGIEESNNEDKAIIKKSLKNVETSVAKVLEDYNPNTPLALSNLYEIVEQAWTDARIRCADDEKIEILLIKACQFSQNYVKRVGPLDFKSAITNILNNSIEAIPESGNVQIEMSKEGEAVKISITDEGTGIPEDILPRIGERGFSHGKKFGNGLGIYSLKKDIQSWGGSFSIKNRREKNGAEVIIIL